MRLAKQFTQKTTRFSSTLFASTLGILTKAAPPTANQSSREALDELKDWQELDLFTAWMPAPVLLRSLGPGSDRWMLSRDGLSLPGNGVFWLNVDLAGRELREFFIGLLLFFECLFKQCNCLVFT